MMTKLRIVMAQLNLTVGDITGNLHQHIAAAIKARDELKADVIVFPELSITGYPAEDLLLRPAFIAEVNKAVDQFVSEVNGIHCVICYPRLTAHGLVNACSLVFNGKIIGTYAKKFLPNYGVFDECRYFVPGTETCVVNIKDIPVGLVICEDLWFPGPTQEAAALGARIILSPNASPFEINKHEARLAILAKRASHNHTPIFYVNQVCGQDELVFDGGSMVVNAEGELCQFAGFFKENLLPVDIEIDQDQIHLTKTSTHLPSELARVYDALVLGLRDYINKNNIPGVLVGVSGGIDSALTTAIAVDALGKDRVHAVMMPSRYTADISHEDAQALIDNLGIRSDKISIEPAYQAFLDLLAPSFAGKKVDVTEENIQARCRAVILMALSNKTGNLVLTTGNRSELATGYCTLYGDMAGGYAVLKDVPKTMVYELCHYRNSISYVIPQSTIERPPTAELAPDQKDQDSLPPYPVLDDILCAYLNKSQSIDEIVEQGFERPLVEKIVKMIKRNEYKRKQSVIGPRINKKSFGKAWRYPLTDRFKG